MALVFPRSQPPRLLPLGLLERLWRKPLRSTEDRVFWRGIVRRSAKPQQPASWPVGRRRRGHGVTRPDMKDRVYLDNTLTIERLKENIKREIRRIPGDMLLTISMLG